MPRNASDILRERAEVARRLVELDLELAEAMADLPAPAQEPVARRKPRRYTRQTHEVTEVDAMRSEAEAVLRAAETHLARRDVGHSRAERQPRCARASADRYEIDPVLESGQRPTLREQVAACGNSVSPPVAAALVAANVCARRAAA